MTPQELEVIALSTAKLVKTAVAEAVAPLQAEILALKAREPLAGPAGPQGPHGERGAEMAWTERTAQTASTARTDLSGAMAVTA